jgi:putative ABC transport system permease protein
MSQIGFWLRWSGRDFRDHWLQISVIAVILGLGIGAYAGLGSTTPWRIRNADQSYARLNMDDLRAQFTLGSYVDSVALIQAANRIDHAAWIEAAEIRLTSTIFVRAGDNILVRGRLMGVDVADNGPHINALYIHKGHGLTEADSGQNVAVLEYHFAHYYNLPPQGQIQVTGDVTMEYIGQGMTPDYFLVITPDGGFMAESNYAVVYVPLETAQTLTHHPGMANELLITATPDADIEVLRAEIDAALKAAFPTTSATLTSPDEEITYQTMYKTIDMNQSIYDIITSLFLAGAVFGAFNLANRIVESMRRQVGIGMALGMPLWMLALRPLLIGVQIMILGVVFGVGLGVVLAKLAEIWILGIISLPVTTDVVDPHVFVEAVALSAFLPLIATIYPVYRALRVSPIEAIRTGNLIEKSSPLVALGTVLPIPGKSFMQIPIRSLLRAPRRTLLTLLGITVSIALLIMMVGTLDSAVNTLGEMRSELLGEHPDQMIVYLNRPYTVDSPEWNTLADPQVVSMAEPSIHLYGTLSKNGTEIASSIDLLDMENDLWTPTVIRGHYPASEGVLISEKAASDLGVAPGDTILLEHPRRTGPLSYDIVTDEIPVVGIHANPARSLVYLDIDQAGLIGLEGTANMMRIDPVGDQSTTKAEFFEQPEVLSVISLRDAVNSAQAVFDEALKFLNGVKIGVFVLAFLIAFNSTNISVSERTREIATMFAFGLPLRTVTRMIITENLVIGVLGTILGILLGIPGLHWMFAVPLKDAFAEYQFLITVSTQTYLMAVLIGVFGVALTPLLVVRKMARMDIPSALRIME